MKDHYSRPPDDYADLARKVRELRRASAEFQAWCRQAQAIDRAMLDYLHAEYAGPLAVIDNPELSADPGDVVGQTRVEWQRYGA